MPLSAHSSAHLRGIWEWLMSSCRPSGLDGTEAAPAALRPSARRSWLCQLVAKLLSVPRPCCCSAGLVAVAKTEAALAALSAQFKARTVMRTYQSITLGCPREAAGQVRTNVGRHFKERKKMGVYEYGGSRQARVCLWLSRTHLHCSGVVPLPARSPCCKPGWCADRCGFRVSASHPFACLLIEFASNMDYLAVPCRRPLAHAIPQQCPGSFLSLPMQGSHSHQQL